MNNKLTYWTSDYPIERFRKDENFNFYLNFTFPQCLLTLALGGNFTIYSPANNKIMDHFPQRQITFEIEEDENCLLQKFGITRPNKADMESNLKYEFSK